jgi:hypothetical protein
MIRYNGVLARNILARVKLNEKVKNFYSAFYPYTMQQNDRVDNISFAYYDDPKSYWMIFLSNEMIDPYHDFYLTDENFRALIIKKYGSVRNAQQKVLFFRNDWADDFQVIPPGAYYALTELEKNYWNPVFNAEGGIMNYIRKREDFYASTNKIMSMSFTSESTGDFVVGERVVRDSSNSAFVTWSSSTGISIQHVLGQFTSETNYTITGETSGATATVDYSTVKVDTQVIPVELESYYQPVYAYDFEEEKNSSKKEILVISKQYRSKIEEMTRSLLRE